MLIITYQGRPSAVVARGRAYLLPSVALLSEYFNLPLEQVGEKRVDLEAAAELAALGATPAAL